MRRRWLALVPVLLVACLCLGLCGCIGQMAFTQGVAKFNVNATDSEWGREAVFVGLLVVPVYELAILADVIVVNSVEFWSGRNPITEEPSMAGKKR